MTPSTDDPDAPLWRAASAFRLVTVMYAVGFQLVVAESYRSTRLSWVLVSLVVVWSGLAGTLLLRRSNRVPVVVADQVVVLAAMASTRLVAGPEWYSVHQVLPTTLWVTNAVVSAAILWGPAAGIGSGALMSVGVAVTKGELSVDLWRDATAPILLTVGLALGVASRAAKRGREQLERAIGLAAATAERERLAREVHDGVLQVLAMVKRRGSEIGGDALELATMAGQQEIALRTLISESRTPAREDGPLVDLRPALQSMESVTVSVSTPGEPVLVARGVADEVQAATRSALDNVDRHAGPGARAFVLVEELPETIVVSVRDDGVGIAAGRIADAESEGRMGVSKSIIGRIRSVGGTAAVESWPGDGTEWEFRIPRGQG
jgi:signal transduction histidine kinase